VSAPLEDACAALVLLCEALVTGCEHATDRRVCGVCARHAHDAIVEAKRVLMPPTADDYLRAFRSPPALAPTVAPFAKKGG